MIKNIGNFRFPLLIFVLLLISCKPTGNKPAGFAASITVTDFREKEVRLAKPTKRIVCLIESALSGLYMLKVENKIVGVPSSVYDESTAEQYALLDNRIKNKQLPAPGNWDFISIENVIALQPDLVILWSSQTEAIESLESRGIPVYGVSISSFEDVYKEMKDLGKLTDSGKRADTLISFVKSEVKAISVKKATFVSTVYFMWAQGELETSGRKSTVNELIEMAGAKNACTIENEHAIVNFEKIMDWNPDIIVMWNNQRKNPEDIINLYEWKNIKAVKTRKVYELPSVFYCDLWTLKFILPVKMLAKWCNSEQYTSMQMKAETDLLMRKLYGKNL